jgi:hypothetical protein
MGTFAGKNSKHEHVQIYVRGNFSNFGLGGFI